MSRALATLLAAATLIGCSKPEQPILTQFFTASRLNDNTSLANFTMVRFDPTVQGIVISFDITNVTPEQRRPLGLRTLAKAHQDAEAAAHAYMTVEVITPDPHSGQPTIDSRSASVDLAKVDREWLITTAELKPTPTRP